MSWPATAFGIVLCSAGLVGCFGDFPQWHDATPPDATGEEPTPDVAPDAASDGAPDRGPPRDMEPDEGPPPVERCNGRDDDGDGATDEGFSVGMPCTAGQGACAVDGQTICRVDGMGIRCDAEAGQPRDELCNAIDDDCSGVIDEGFEAVGDACEVGQGACRAAGILHCAADGADVECSAQPNEAARDYERCNGLDDDCGGEVDEALVRSCQAEAVGVCLAGRETCSDGGWSACVGDVEPGDQRDACNGLDDDCDFAIDEDELPDGPAPCGPECEAIVDGCVPATPCVEQCRPDGGVGFVCAPGPEVDCDGRDDDCDGVIDDDRICGEPIVETCFFGLGWSVDEVESPAEDWGSCIIDAGGFDETYSCNRTRSDGFTTIDLPEGADVDAADDALGVVLRCGAGPVGEYIAGRCRIVLGVATADAGVADGAEAWGPCPAARVGGNRQIACTSNTAAGEFLPMPVPFDLTADTLMGVAFICDDPLDPEPERARALESSLAVSLAWADGSIGGEIDWASACAPLGDGEPLTACATTRGDGRFRVLRLTADVDGGDRFAIRLDAL